MVNLTEYSKRGGCGCKISPNDLRSILDNTTLPIQYPNLIVGNDTSDDAAVYKINENLGIVSTTDFFMPIVDDPHTFGKIAAANAISDIFAMGGKPIMAISILGWPLEILPALVAQQVIKGAQEMCSQAAIPLCGGHSIQSQEPIFGLSVTGQVKLDQIKRNNTATSGCKVYLTKPLGIGIYTTALKKKILKPEHQKLAIDNMCKLNTVGEELACIPEVKAMTDVTGFGLLGHLLEVCENSHVQCHLYKSKIPILPNLDYYINQECCPGGTTKNYNSYRMKVCQEFITNSFTELNENDSKILSDPQTSGGLLIFVTPDGENIVNEILHRHKNVEFNFIGETFEYKDDQSKYIILKN